MQVRWVHVDELPEERYGEIENRLRAIAAEHDDVIDVRISGRESAHHRYGAKQICIDCAVRGKEIVAVRDGVSLGLALDEALDAFERELRKYRRRIRERVADLGSTPPHLGIVDRLFAKDGYGFILTDDGESVYFHVNAVRGGLEFAELREGERVALQVEPGEKGLQASAVVAPPPGTPSP